jgi:hypothetical protein
MITIDLRKLLVLLVLLGVGVFVLQYPDIQRYLRIRNM